VRVIRVDGCRVQRYEGYCIFLSFFLWGSGDATTSALRGRKNRLKLALALTVNRRH